MKKLSVILFAALLFFGAVRVNAMTEAELKDALTQTIEINGSKYTVDDGTKTAIERYLNQYDVSSAHADYINARINTAISILKSEGQTDFKKLSTTAKNKLKALVEEISNNTSVKATVTNGSVVVLDPTGGTFYEVDHLVKQTGSTATLIGVLAGVSLLVVAAGACLVVKQVKEN
jgi:hypothetical protein